MAAAIPWHIRFTGWILRRFYRRRWRSFWVRYWESEGISEEEQMRIEGDRRGVNAFAPELLGHRGGRILFVAQVDRVSDWPETIVGPVEPFVCLIAMDASRVDSDALVGFAKRLMSQGAVILCAWGSECERVHDAFDEGWRPSARFETTCFPDEPLDEALWYALVCTHSEETAAELDMLAITVARPDWAEHITSRLSNADAFVRENVDADRRSGLI